MTRTDTYDGIVRDNLLPPDAAELLLKRGFVVLPGPEVPGGIGQLHAAYDSAVASADSADVRVASSTRVTDCVNRSIEFDRIYIYPPLLAACCLVIGQPFKLSNTCTRTLEPGAPAQKLHADVRYGADAWPMVGFIWMVDAFDAENGATRFVPGSHLRHHAPDEHDVTLRSQADEEILGCGPAGSLIIFNASVWHGHSPNRSAHPRRSVQGHFVAREAQDLISYRDRMRPETLARIGDLARYLLCIPQGRGELIC